MLRRPPTSIWLTESEFKTNYGRIQGHLPTRCPKPQERCGDTLLLIKGVVKGTCIFMRLPSPYAFTHFPSPDLTPAVFNNLGSFGRLNAQYLVWCRRMQEALSDPNMDLMNSISLVGAGFRVAKELSRVVRNPIRYCLPWGPEFDVRNTTMDEVKKHMLREAMEWQSQSGEEVYVEVERPQKRQWKRKRRTGGAPAGGYMQPTVESGDEEGDVRVPVYRDET